MRLNNTALQRCKSPVSALFVQVWLGACSRLAAMRRWLQHQAVAWRAERRRDRPVLIRWAPSAIGVLLGINAVVGAVAAQSSTVCGTTIAAGTQQTARLAIGLIILGCIVVAGIAEGYARLKRDPQEALKIKKWRNNAAIGAVSTPSIMWVVVRIAGFYNIPVVRCINLVPFL